MSIEKFKIRTDEGVGYEGSIDVLLTLINKEHLEITDLSLIKITKQYIQYINSRQIPPDSLVEFLYTLSILLLIKSKSLLSLKSEEDELEIEDFKKKLSLIQQLKSQAKLLRKKYNHPSPILSRSYRDISELINYKSVDMESINREKLLSSFLKLRDEYEKFHAVEEAIKKRRQIRLDLSLRKKMDFIKESVRSGDNILFKKLFTSKVEAVISFLAILEMSKNNYISICQNNDFSDIIIKPA